MLVNLIPRAKAIGISFLQHTVRDLLDPPTRPFWKPSLPRSVLVRKQSCRSLRIARNLLTMR